MYKFNYSPLRYPGGKVKLYELIKEIIEKNNLRGCIYIEPFAGGAGLALALLMNGIVDKVVLNDLDKSIYAFWYSILNLTDDFIEKILKTPLTLEEWIRQREVQKNKSQSNLFELGFSTFFLNRTNRSGIINGGPIGGKKQEGKYKIGDRFNKKNLIKRIRKIVNYKDKIEIYNLDALEFIDSYKFNTQCFVYFDPPYYNKGPELYQNSYTHLDHLKLSKKVQKLKNIAWIMTYDNVAAIKEMYSNFHVVDIELIYTAGKIKAGQEILIYGHNIIPLEPLKNPVFKSAI